jgi:hypothetical protein
MRIDIISSPITKLRAKEIAKECYEVMVKGVVDVERRIIALGGEWHMDANMKLIGNGSHQRDVWGFNYYPDEDRLVFTALINIRPAEHNRSMEVQDASLRQRMEEVIRALII